MEETTVPTTIPTTAQETEIVITTPTTTQPTFDVDVEATLPENVAPITEMITPLAQEKVVVCTADKLNVRTGPGTSYAIIAQLMEGMEVTVTGQTSTGWYQLKEGKYFVSKEYFTDKT